MFKKLFLKSIVGTMCLGMAVSAQANIIVYLPAIAGVDICEQLPGQWSGHGQITAVGILKCKYKGDIHTVSLGGSAYSLHVALDKLTGICPAHEDIQLTAQCNNGVITIKTDNADLNGSMGGDGRSVDFTGKLKFIVAGTKITANVDEMHIQKK